MMDLRLAMMCGTDIPVPECQLVIHQPKIKEIALIGEQDYFTGIYCLCLKKNMFLQDETLLTNASNFQIFMTVMTEQSAADKKASVQQVCTLLFPERKVLFTPRSMIISGGNSPSITIDEENFDALQQAIEMVGCVQSNSSSQQIFNPADKKAKEIAEKIMRGRQRVAAQKGESSTSVISQYISAMTIGIPSMSLQNLMDLTLYQLYDLVERFSLYTNWDLDVRSRLAGGNPESKPDNWMKNIH